MIISNPIPYPYIYGYNGEILYYLRHNVENWDMDTDNSRTELNIVPAGYRISSYAGAILHDTTSYEYPLTHPDMSNIYIYSYRNMSFYRSAGGIFDHPDFDDDTITRIRLDIFFTKV